MKHPNGKFHSLSRRIIWRFCLFTLVISSVYGLITLSLMYNIEDSFIERGVAQEAEYLKAQFNSTGRWPSPRATDMQLVFSDSELPEDIKALAIEEPYRKEFFGPNGLHYHLYRFSDYPETYLVAEVSEQLLVRPIRGGVIQFLVISTATVTVLACFIAWLIGRRTTRPLNELASAVDGVDITTLSKEFAQQRFSYSNVNHSPNNEVDILARAFDRTLKRIALAMEREQSFTRDVSHELRTLLAVIKNAVEVAQLNANSDQRVLERIANAAEQMEKTVETLLMLAREEHTPSRSTPVPLMPILEQAVLDNRLLLDGKPVEVEIDDSCNTQVLAEPNVLKVILDNIVSNAFKYTLQGCVSFTVQNGTLHLKDTGPGLQEDIANSVTQRGVKGEQSTGLGFGLSIVKRLCEHQGLALTVLSPSDDAGTEITLRLH
ncbi:sensor histidine kinase [Alteromonas sp. D210916BOD_24]|uniref:sensor histidine kinase n=1 Tax=Alteromonas sp. D210916BOD_24 TaxID=3157618 RepID=UPI00399C751E